MKNNFTFKKDKKEMKFKSIRKNLYNKKGKKLKMKKQNALPQTLSSIEFEEQMQDDKSYNFRMRQYKEKMNQLKNFFKQAYQQFNFSSEDTFYQRQNIQKVINFHPISIDRLFDHRLGSFFSSSYSLYDSFQYLKILNNSLQKKHRKIILSQEGEILNLTKQIDRHQNKYSIQGRFISQLQKELYQNRENFMEKVKSNQSKYQQSSTQLSEISQQILFLSKVYIENSSKMRKIVDKLDLTHQESLQKNQQQKLTEKLYVQILVNKNKSYAFRNQDIEYLNYFLLKQIEENNLSSQDNKIYNQNQLLVYLRNKKFKKGKSALAAACSCCFSGYYEAYNPLILCQNCNLRCHKLCYDLKEKSCGNCSYQRIPKSEKEKIPFCFICKQKGQMTIKLGLKVFAHGFCLLFHNLWKVVENSVNFNQDKKKMNTNIVYFQQEKIIKDQVTKTTSEFQNQIMPSLTSIVQLNTKNQNRDLSCALCQQKFQSRYYTQCKHCQKKYHGYCAFFKGFCFQQNKEPHQQKNYRKKYHLDCCQISKGQKQQLQRKRKFILNKNRYLFQGI